MDIVCFSHLRWNFVYQRPQHLLTRCAKTFRVFYVEEPVFCNESAGARVETIGDNLFVVSPFLPHGLTEEEGIRQQQEVLRDLLTSYEIKKFIAWFYTPMALPLLEGLPDAELIIYDCMDELSGFKNAPVLMQQRELELFQMADVVFTGGQYLYESKKHLHSNIHAFPSSIDKKHFATARNIKRQPPDQYYMNGPRIGFFGVIDERLDIGLLNAIATKQPSWNLILIGPVVKIDPATLPRHANIHYLGPKDYKRLPEYLGGWDVALIPFALNEATKFISPTKTPEYLAGGIPVVSTAIHDVIEPYERNGLVYVGKDHDDFIEGITYSLSMKRSGTWIKAVDHFLQDMSWDTTWEKMLYQVNQVLLHSTNTIKNSHV